MTDKQLERGDVVYHRKWNMLCIIVDESDVYGGYYLINNNIEREINTHAYQAFGYRELFTLVSRGDFENEFK